MKWSLYITVYFLLKCGMSFSQKQADYWYFGNKAGLNFATNPPTILTDGAMKAGEGCATVSDAGGNLLFYTGSDTIWNKNHQIMANGTGLLGSQNSTQAALIVKKPASNTLYYVFYLDEIILNVGTNLYYSIVDMSLASGQGSVTVKNVLVQSNLTEKLAGTLHCNGTDVWVMVHDYFSDIFRSYLVTATGLSNSAVTSSIGAVHSIGGFQGQLKFSPNGKKLGLITSSFAEIFDFNNVSGLVSNVLSLGNYPGHGCEYSPDGSKFYSIFFDTVPVVYISQWDLCAGTNSAVISSQYLIPGQYYPIYQMQLSNNGKIYVVKSYDQSLGVINDPDQIGAACGYSAYAQSVAPKSTYTGLPNFVSGFYKSPIPVFSQTQSSLTCQTLTFSPNTNYLCQQTINPGLTCLWNFGDPASGANNISNQTNPVHNFSAGGTYTVVLTYLYPCYSQTVASTVQVKKQPQVKINGLLSGTINVCNGSTITLQASGAESYSWSTGASSPSINTTSTSTGFTITGIDTSTNCKSTRTVQVKYISCTGIEKNAVTTSVFSIYPNPGKDIYNFETEKSCKIEVRNLLGATVYMCDVAEGIHTLNLESLADGVYFFCVLVDDKWQIQKMIKDSKN